jgi:CheY-like chemotaxis protein
MESITNHKALLAQNKELQSASRGLASVAHDLLTPLSGLHLSLSLLNGDGDFTSKMHAQQKESMSTASCCTEVMMKICDSLRINNGSPHQDIPEAASKPEEAQCRLSPTSFDTNTLISRLDQIMASVAKQVPVSIVASATLPPVVRGEEVGVFRAALSLLTNSCERTNTGFIRMTISVLESPGSHSEPKLVFDCEDSGPSITSDEQQQLIESLSDGSNPLDSYATCKRISSPAKWSLLSMVSIVGHIYSLGGTFGISSGENGLENGLNGTTTRFWFKLPLVILDETPQLSLKCDEPLACRKISNADNLVSFVPSTNTSIRRKKALMIDDSIIILKTLSRALSKLGYETSQAANGLEGLKFMQHSTYDLVLCDFLMPIMDGLDCVREYRSWEQLNRPGFIQYIVGISAHASGKDSERGLEIGMNKYMSKPITLKDLDELQTNSDLVAMGKMLDETEQQFENCDTISPKRRKMTPVMNKSMGEFDKRRACLICTDESDLGRLREITENQGWKAVVSSTYADALSHLKSRNWDAVVLDGELAVVSFVNQFRDWEEQNRVHRQRNLYLMSTGFELVPNGSDLAALVQVPPGFDGAVGKPANSDMIAALLRKAEDMRVFGAEAIVVSS